MFLRNLLTLYLLFIKSGYLHFSYFRSFRYFSLKSLTGKFNILKYLLLVQTYEFYLILFKHLWWSIHVIGSFCVYTVS